MSAEFVETEALKIEGVTIFSRENRDRKSVMCRVKDNYFTRCQRTRRGRRGREVLGRSGSIRDVNYFRVRFKLRIKATLRF